MYILKSIIVLKFLPQIAIYYHKFIPKALILLILFDFDKKKIYYIIRYNNVIKEMGWLDMKIGISTGCLYPMLTENSVELLTDIGFDTLEIFFNSFSELEPDYLDRLRYILDKKGASVASVHPFTSSYESFLLFSNYERRFEDGIKFYEMFFRTAQKLSADKVILHGLITDYRSSLENEEYFRRFERLRDTARAYGTELLQENVAKFKSGDPLFISDMKNYFGEDIGFVCDTKQARRKGLSPVVFTDIMGTSLKHVHISGYTDGNECILPDESSAPATESFVRHLIQTGYQGDIIIEVYRFSFENISQLAKTKKYLENIVKKYSGLEVI